MRALLVLICVCACAQLLHADEPEPAPAEKRQQAALEKAIARHPDSAAAQIALAEFLSDRGRTREALPHWRMAQLLDPQNAAVANSLGGIYLRMGRAQDSAEQFQRAVQNAQTNAAYHYNLANVEFMLRHELTAAWHIDNATLLERALVEFRAASHLSPNDLEYARGYAETFFGLPDPDWSEAEAAWKHVLQLSHQRDFAYLQLARVSLKLGHKKEAQAFLDQITDPRHDALKEKLRAQAKE